VRWYPVHRITKWIPQSTLPLFSSMVAGIGSVAPSSFRGFEDVSGDGALYDAISSTRMVFSGRSAGPRSNVPFRVD